MINIIELKKPFRYHKLLYIKSWKEEILKERNGNWILKWRNECQGLFVVNKKHVVNESLRKCSSKERGRSVETIERDFRFSFRVTGAKRVFDVPKSQLSCLRQSENYRALLRMRSGMTSMHPWRKLSRSLCSGSPTGHNGSRKLFSPYYR